MHVRVLGGDPAAADYSIGEGRMANAPGEAVVGYGLVDEDGVRIGDALTLQLGGRAVAVTVVGWYRETEDSGRVIQLRDDGATPILADRAPTYAVVAAPGTTRGQLAGALRALGGEVEVNRPDGTALAPFRTAMATMTALIAAVAVAHLLATALATARERTRSTAILRAVGGTTGQIAAAAAVGAAVTAVCATAVGVPLGLWLQGLLGDAITSSIGVGPGASAGPPVRTTAATIAVLMLAAVVAVTAAELRTARRTVARTLAAG